MRNHEQAWRSARDEQAFSNGTEAFAWQENWCDRCVHDAAFRRDEDSTGCPLLIVAITGRTPAEWFEQPWRQIKGRPEGETAPVLGDTYHCAEFRDVDDPGGRDPEPAPDPPDMDGLFERPEPQVRMFVQPSAVKVQA